MKRGGSTYWSVGSLGAFGGSKRKASRPSDRLTFAIERAKIELPITKRATIVDVPLPPSTNNLFFNMASGGRKITEKYRAWKNEAAQMVRAQGVRRVPGRVFLSYTFEDGATKADIGNLEKAATDMLVDLGVIDGDGPSVVRGISLRWENCKRMCIEVLSADEGAK